MDSYCEAPPSGPPPGSREPGPVTSQSFQIGDPQSPKSTRLTFEVDAAI